MDQVMASIEESEEARDQLERIGKLRARLRMPTTICGDLTIEEKHMIRNFYSWFSARELPLKRFVMPPEASEGPGLSFDYSADMFATAGGKLDPSLKRDLKTIYRELGYSLSYSVLMDSDIPLTLYVPDERAMKRLRMVLPSGFQLFCTITVSSIGQVVADAMSIDQGTSDAF
jgi:hypothetical protein